MRAWVDSTPVLMLAIAGFGYALGIVNPAHYLVRLRRGYDIRDLGSGNAGATNAGRVLGRWGFVVVLILDGAKGAAPVGLAQWVSDDPLLALTALAGAILGHIWPLQLGFRGGKGVSTLLGGMLVIDAGAVAIIAAIVLPLLVIIRRFVPSGLLAMAALPLALYVRHASPSEAAGALALVGIVWFAHRDQLKAEFHRFWGQAQPSLDRPRLQPRRKR